MGSSFLIALREGLEAALIIGIILINLRQTKREDLKRPLFLGLLLGAAAAIFSGLLGIREVLALKGNSENIFEGSMLLLAASLIGYFVVWVGTRTLNVGREVRKQIDSNISVFGITLLGFITVFRDGLELAVFNLAKTGSGISQIVAGTVAGLIVAITVVYAIFKTSFNLNINLVFKILGLVLIYIGAEMFAEGVFKFISINEDTYGIWLMLLFILPSLYFFFRNDLSRRPQKI